MFISLQCINDDWAVFGDELIMLLGTITVWSLSYVTSFCVVIKGWNVKTIKISDIFQPCITRSHDWWYWIKFEIDNQDMQKDTKQTMFCQRMHHLFCIFLHVFEEKKHETDRNEKDQRLQGEWDNRYMGTYLISLRQYWYICVDVYLYRRIISLRHLCVWHLLTIWHLQVPLGRLTLNTFAIQSYLLPFASAVMFSNPNEAWDLIWDFVMSYVSSQF